MSVTRRLTMKNYLLKMAVYGVKNIDKKVELNFYNKVLKKKPEFKNCNVKAIYGANGSGKTAIMYAAEIYKQFVIDKDYVAYYTRNSNLYNLINKNTHRMEVEMVFAVLNDDMVLQNIYSHNISFALRNDILFIEGEHLKKLHGYRINDESKFETIYEVKNGELINNTNEFLSEASKNILAERSVVSNIIYQSIGKPEIEKQPIFSDILDVYGFAQNLTIVINGTDKNYINLNYIVKQMNAIAKYEKEFDSNLFNKLLFKQKLVSPDELIIDKEMFGTFKQDMTNMCKFIQVFKSDLSDIDVKEEEMADSYVCNVYFVYNDGKRIARQYESTGIKKLMTLYYALCDVDAGKIVFIDEFDANIHDIILIKLIEYIQSYSKGQFIFTTHNLGPMDVLQNSKYSIDFLSNDSQIVPWVKFGNSSAASVYTRGLIKYSPFNIEAFDFLGVFNSESNK